MDKEIVIIVPDETAAYDVVRALKALDDEGSIELYSSTVVVKSTEGVQIVRDGRHFHAPVGTALGLTTGALIGLLAGPVGAAIGAAVGGATGLGADAAYSGFAGDFVQEVSARLPVGGYAVVASISEGWTVPVDTAVAPYGIVLRQATDDVVIAQINAGMRALEEEAMQIEAEIAQSAGETKAKLEAKRAELRAKQAAQRERLRKRAAELEQRWDAKLESIKQKQMAARDAAKLRHQQHMEKLSRFASMQKASFRQLFS